MKERRTRPIELHGGSKILDKVPHVSSLKQWVLEYPDAQEIEEVGIQTEIVNALLEAVRELGFNPDDVLFSGYEEDPSYPDDGKLGGPKGEWGDRFTEEKIALLQKAKLKGVGVGIEERFAALERRKNLPKEKFTYFVNNIEGLRTPVNDYNYNPLDWASMHQGATICVYSRARIEEIDPDYQLKGFGHDEQDVVQTGGVEGIVDATPEEMGSALILLWHPRYVGVDGKPFMRERFL